MSKHDSIFSFLEWKRQMYFLVIMFSSNTTMGIYKLRTVEPSEEYAVDRNMRYAERMPPVSWRSFRLVLRPFHLRLLLFLKSVPFRESFAGFCIDWNFSAYFIIFFFKFFRERVILCKRRSSSKAKFRRFLSLFQITMKEMDNLSSFSLWLHNCQKS